MSIFDLVPDFFKKRKFSDLSDRQNALFLEALALAMAVDGATDVREKEQLQKIAGYLPWSGNEEDPALVASSMLDRAKEKADTPAGRQELAEEISAGLEEDWLREEAYFAAAKIVGADQRIAEQETDFLQALVSAFEIPRDRLQVLTNRLIREDHV